MNANLGYLTGTHSGANKDATLQENYEKLQASNQFNLMIYGLLILGLVIFCATKTVQYYLICMTASRNLHNVLQCHLVVQQARHASRRMDQSKQEVPFYVSNLERIKLVEALV